MKKTIRCCISCILPCGALDVIRIVHSNGRVQEISGGACVRAADVMRAHPKHVLKKPSTSDVAVVVVPPDALLHRGNIYFLIPDHSKSKSKSKSSSKRSSSQSQSLSRSSGQSSIISTATSITSSSTVAATVDLLVSDNSDRYLAEILSEKLSTHRDRRRGRSAVWRPHLESISESPNLS